MVWGRMLHGDRADMRLCRQSLGPGAAFSLKDYLASNAGVARGSHRFRGDYIEEETEVSSRGLTFEVGVSLFFP